MRLRNLRVRNFRAFPEARETPFDLDHSVVVLYGPNGSGKTGLFDALELMLTGRVRRIEHFPDAASLLVNVRAPEKGAELSLEWLDGAVGKTSTKILPRDARFSFEPALSTHDSRVFEYTTYLPQSNLRRLVSADSSTLGDIASTLAIGEEADKLFRGVSKARIHRNDPGYRAVAQGVQRLADSIRQTEAEIQGKGNLLKAGQGTRVGFEEAAARVREVAVALGVETDGLSVVSAESLLSLLARADSVLGDRLTDALRAKADSERRLQACERLASEEASLDAKGAMIAEKERAAEDLRKDIEAKTQQTGELHAQVEAAQRELADASRLPTLIRALREMVLST
jgi:DNA repair exonuclease SbcCD ATPase subunit